MEVNPGVVQYSSIADYPVSGMKPATLLFLDGKTAVDFEAWALLPDSWPGMATDP